MLFWNRLELITCTPAGDVDSILSSKSKEFTFAENAVWAIEEEIEAAIVQVLPRQPSLSSSPHRALHCPYGSWQVWVCRVFRWDQKIILRSKGPAIFCECNATIVLIVLAQGFLDDEYRTSLCTTVVENMDCHLGSICSNAHSVADMRIEAAISQGKLDPDYKTRFCDDFMLTGVHRPCITSYEVTHTCLRAGVVYTWLISGPNGTFMTWCLHELNV
jgi:hypothetical protein